MKLKDMMEQRSALKTEADTILSSEMLTVEQEARGNEIANQIQELDGRIKAAQLRERFASYTAMERGLKENELRTTDWIATKEYRSQFIDWVRGGRMPESRGIAETRDVDVTSGTYSVLFPKVYEEGLLRYLERNTVVRNLANLRTGVKGSVTLRRNNLETDAAASNFWTTEASKATTALDGSWSEINLNPEGGLPKSEVTQWAVRQSDFDIETEIIFDMQRKIARGLESAYTVGTGTNQPKGLFVWDSDYKSVNVSAAHGSGSGWDGAFTLANLLELRYKTLPAEYWTSAAWVMSQDAYHRIASLTPSTGTNVPIFAPSSDVQVLENAAPMTLLGRPVYIAPYAPGRQTAAVTNSVPLMFANVQEAFAIREWGGISMFRDDVTTPGTIKFQGMVFSNSKVVRPKAVAALRITLT